MRGVGEGDGEGKERGREINKGRWKYRREGKSERKE